MSWKVTVRHGSEVESASHETLDSALAEARRQAAAVAERGGLDATSAFREYAPGQQVEARIEVSESGLRGSQGGVDVMGDGSLVAYSGLIRKRRLDPSGDGPFEALRRALEG